MHNDAELIIIEPEAKAEGCVIWLHGLGADGQDFVPLVPELQGVTARPLRFIFPHAPLRPITVNNGRVMRGWYDIASLELIQEDDRSGLEESAARIAALVEGQVALGIAPANIILAGFSQGGALVLYAALQHRLPVGGVIVLSSYWPKLAPLDSLLGPAIKRMPIFLAHGLFDAIVPFSLGDSLRQQLVDSGYPVNWSTYPMAHTIVHEEILAFTQFISQVLAPAATIQSAR